MDESYKTGVMERAEKLIKVFMKKSPVDQFRALDRVRYWAPDLYAAYVDLLKSDKSIRIRFLCMSSPEENRHTRLSFQCLWPQVDLSHD